LITLNLDRTSTGERDMRHITWFFAVAALLLGCSASAAAQCAGNNTSSVGGYDLLQTMTGTQDNLSSLGLGTVTFSGSPLPGVGTTDTIVCRITPLPSPIPSGGATLNIQVVALLLSGNATYTNSSNQTTNVTVYATINQTQNAQGTYTIPLSQLPVPDQFQMEASTGTMTVASNGTFNTNSLNIQADLIVVPQGQPVTATPIFTAPMPADTLASSGSTWTTAPPSGYPSSTTFPSGGFYVNEPGAGGATITAIRVARPLLYGLGVVVVGLAVIKVRSGVRGGRLTLRPVYLLALAAVAWFLAWRSSKIVFPHIVHAAICCVPGVTVCTPRTTTVWVNEGGVTVVHQIVGATGCKVVCPQCPGGGLGDI
jgi:hypothetical protein